MRMTSALVERAPGETEVTITSQVNVMGILAQFGRGMIQDVSDQMFDTFVAAARAELEKPESPRRPRRRCPADVATGGTAERAGAADARTDRSRRRSGRGAVARIGGRRPRGGRCATRPSSGSGIVVLLVLVWFWWDEMRVRARKSRLQHEAAGPTRSDVIDAPQRKDRSMIPASFDYHAPDVAGRRDRAAAAPRRSGQGAVRRTEPAAAAQASRSAPPSTSSTSAGSPGSSTSRRKAGS